MALKLSELSTRSKNVMDAFGYHLFAGLVQRGVKFALPDNGRIFDDDLRGIDGMSLRLPFPEVVIEFFVQHDEAQLKKDAPHYSPKRVIALKTISRTLLEKNEQLHKAGRHVPYLPLNVGDMVGDEFILMMAACYMPVIGSWQVMPATFIFEIENWNLEKRDGVDATRGRLAFILGDTANEILKEHGLERGRWIMENDIAPEIRATLEFLEAVNCANIATRVHQEAARPSLAAKRQKAGKRPIYETKVLTIDLGFRVSADAPIGTGVAGDRARPREHLRRGHVRRLSDERRIWIPAMVVNPGVAGRVEKQYRVRA